MYVLRVVKLTWAQRWHRPPPAQGISPPRLELREVVGLMRVGFEMGA